MFPNSHSIDQIRWKTLLITYSILDSGHLYFETRIDDNGTCDLVSKKNDNNKFLIIM